MPSPSLSARHGSVWTCSSRPFVIPSPSASASGAALALAAVHVGALEPPPPSLEPPSCCGCAGSTVGDRRSGVNLAPKRLASTRRRKRVAPFSPLFLPTRYRPSLLV